MSHEKRRLSFSISSSKPNQEIDAHVIPPTSSQEASVEATKFACSKPKSRLTGRRRSDTAVTMQDSIESRETLDVVGKKLQRLMITPTDLESIVSEIDTTQDQMRLPTKADMQEHVGISLYKSSRGRNDEALQRLEADILELNVSMNLDIPPVRASNCTGGVYRLRSKERGFLAIFKPADEEAYAVNNPKRYRRHKSLSSKMKVMQEQKRVDTVDKEFCAGIRPGIPAGHGAIRDVAAYLLGRAANVPPASMASIYHPSFKYRTPLASKMGAIMQYRMHHATADRVSSSHFSTKEVHAISILDIRLSNQDRHGGNILVRQRSSKNCELIPIDHGGCLPQVTHMSETSFVWMFWPHSRSAFDAETLQSIMHLDASKDEQMLLQLLPEECQEQLEPSALLTLHICTALLQICAVNYKMTAYQIGMIMIRHGTGKQQESKKSVLEELVDKSLAGTEDFREKHSISLLSRERNALLKSKNWEQYVAMVITTFRYHLSHYIASDACHTRKK